MGKFKGTKGGSRSTDDQDEEALAKVLSNGYTSADEHGLPGRQGRRRMGPAGRSIMTLRETSLWQTFV